MTNNNFKIEGETLFEVDVMTKHSVSPMTIEVSRLVIDGVDFMLVRLFDTDGDIVEQFTDVISTMEKAVEWILALGLDDFSTDILMEAFETKAPRFMARFLLRSFFKGDFDC